ncbi:MAG: hypothetical protein ABJN69_07575 [Hellea sp.]
MTRALKRRQILQGGAGLLTTALSSAAPAHARQPKTAIGELKMDTNYTPSGKGIVTGKGVGDFDFLTGHWDIQHKKLKSGSKNDWERFDSRAVVHRVLDGMGSIEELHKADDSFMGMGVRIWRPELGKWADHWTSAANGVVNDPQFGTFIDGDGIFISEHEVDGVNWQYRGVWDRITPKSCRWHQSASKDEGQSWDWNWWMEWTRQS